MKDIYIIMNTQNILRYYGRKLEINTDFSQLIDYTLDNSNFIDLKLDNSEFIDYRLENSGYVDLKLDYSGYVDFELDFIDDRFMVPITVYNPIIDVEVSYINYAIQSQDGVALLSQSGELIQFQY